MTSGIIRMKNEPFEQPFTCTHLQCLCADCIKKGVPGVNGRPPAPGVRRLHLHCHRDRVQDGESCLILVGETAGEQLQPINGTVHCLLLVWSGAELQY